MTLTEKAVCAIYTGCDSFCVGYDRSAVYEYAERLMGRPVDAYELKSEYIAQKLKELSKLDFIKICRDIPLGFVLGEGGNDIER